LKRKTYHLDIEMDRCQKKVSISTGVIKTGDKK